MSKATFQALSARSASASSIQPGISQADDFLEGSRIGKLKNDIRATLRSLVPTSSGGVFVRLDVTAWERWVSWIEKVRIDIKGALTDRVVFRRFNDVLRENRGWIAEHYGRRFCEFVAKGYVAGVAAAVRRHSRSHRDAIMLTGILEQMEKCAPQFTFDFFLVRFPGDGADHFTQRATFKYVSQDGRVASEALIRQDIEELQRRTATVEAFVDKKLAHVDRKGLASPATFSDLDNALDALDRMACKYLTLLTGDYRDTLAGKTQEPWEEIFTVPLIKPPSA